MLRVTKSAVTLKVATRRAGKQYCSSKPAGKGGVEGAKPARVTPPPVAPPTPEPKPPPPPSGGGGGGRTFFKLLGAAVFVGVPGVVAYSWYDKNFRKMLSSLPYVMEPLDAVLSKLPSRARDIEESPVAGKPLSVPALKENTGKARAIKIPDVPEQTKPQEDTKPKIKEIKVEEKKEKSRDELRAEAAARKLEEATRRRIEKEEIARKIKEREAEEAAENAALEHILGGVGVECGEALDLARVAQVAAVAAVKMHTQQIRQAMDTKEKDKEAVWQVVTEAYDSKQTALAAAEETANAAREAFEKLKHAVDDGKSSPMTKKNREIYNSEKLYNKVTYDLNKQLSQVKKAEAEGKAMMEFRDLVAKGKKQFQKELESITPDVKLGAKGKLTEEELNSLIAHAHRRIEQLQRQLIEQQVLEGQRLEQAMDKQRTIDEDEAEETVKQELANQRQDFHAEKLRWDAEANVKFEQELRRELSRQAGAHSDHLADVLRVQAQQLEQELHQQLQAGVMAEREKFSMEIAAWVARLKGIETAVEGRAEMERTGRKAQELWLACQTLTNTILVGREGQSWEEQRKPLANDLMAVKEAGLDNPFVTLLVDTIPDEAKINGVWTEEALRQRFLNVKRTCKRVAMIDETGGTLFKFFVSWLQSFFVIDAAKIIRTDEINAEDLDTFALIANADYCLKRGDLEQAVRYLNQLKGESGRVAADWINDARLLLETRQCSRSLLSHASASGLGSLF